MAKKTYLYKNGSETILFSNVNDTGTYFNIENNDNKTGPIINYVDYGYDTLNYKTNNLSGNQIKTFTLPQDADNHRLINSIDINWCSASVDVEISSSTTNRYIINTTDDLIKFINDSYSYPLVDTSNLVPDSEIPSKVANIYGVDTFETLSNDCNNLITIVNGIIYGNPVTTYDPQPVEELVESDEP